MVDAWTERLAPMTPVILIGNVAKGRERSAADLFAALTRLVSLAAMGMGSDDGDQSPPPPPRLTLIRTKPHRRNPEQDFDVR